MITDDRLRKLCALLAIVGVAGIVIISSLPGEILAVREITRSRIGQIVTVSGAASAASLRNGTLFITLADDTGSIAVVMFERTSRGQALSTIGIGSNLTVTGKITLYRGELEVVADRIVLGDDI